MKEVAVSASGCLRKGHVQPLSSGLRGALAKLQSNGMRSSEGRRLESHTDNANCKFCGHEPSDLDHELFYCSTHEPQEDEEEPLYPDGVLSARKDIWSQGQTDVGLERDFTPVNLLYAIPLRLVFRPPEPCLLPVKEWGAATVPLPGKV
eukprot:7921987-Pyramimonas_sp.AAC.1